MIRKMCTNLLPASYKRSSILALLWLCRERCLTKAILLDEILELPILTKTPSDDACLLSLTSDDKESTNAIVSVVG